MGLWELIDKSYSDRKLLLLKYCMLPKNTVVKLDSSHIHFTLLTLIYIYYKISHTSTTNLASPSFP